MSLLNLGNFLGDVITQTGHAVTEITSSTAHSISGIASNIVSNIHIDAKAANLLHLNSDVDLNASVGQIFNGAAAEVGHLLTGATSSASDIIADVASTADHSLDVAASSARDLFTGLVHHGLNLDVDAHLPGILDLHGNIGLLTPEHGLLDIQANLHLLGGSGALIG